MAKKADIKNLLEGIVGEPKGQNEENEDRVSSELVNQLGITPEMEDKLNQLRKERTGRPKKGASSTKDENETRATFIVDKRIVRKIKYISLADGRLLKDVISEALCSYVDTWEKDNKKIQLPKIKED